jgi:serine/threonine protein phosphatase PrpC
MDSVFALPGTASRVTAVSTLLVPSNDPTEDGHVACTEGRLSFFAVVDGHSGHMVKDVLCAELPTMLAAAVQAGGDAGAVLRRLVSTAEQRVMGDAALHEAGACVVFALVSPEEASVHIASVGDCAAIQGCLFESTVRPYRMSGVIHNLSSAVELFGALEAKKGVECDEGTFYLMSPDGSGGGIQTTRSIGDRSFKAATVGTRKRRSVETAAVMSSEPFVEDEKLDGKTPLAFLVLCTDGVTDQLSDGEICAAVARHVAAGGAREAAAQAVVDEALLHAAFAQEMESAAALRAVPVGDERRSLVDDMTCMVVFFR